MKLERAGTQRYSVILADNNILFRRGLFGLLSAEADFLVAAQVGSEAELLVALERQPVDAVICTSEFLSPGSFFAATYRAQGYVVPVVSLIAESATPALDGQIAAFSITRHEVRAKLIGGLRNLLRPEASASRHSADLQAFVMASQQIRPDVLTHREKEVVKLLSDGLTVREAADELGLSCKTVEAHTLNLMRKLDIHSRASLIEYAVANGLTAEHILA